MFSKFSYKPEAYFNAKINQYFKTGERLYEKNKQEIKKCLDDFLLVNGHIDGTALKNYWFKNIKADVFISHSHSDKDKVIAFAGWLNCKFGLTSFIDSTVWGYCDELLKEIDNKYCKNTGRNTYDYNLRNCSTSHVHIMLATALAEMMDKTECLIFFNTPKSIILSDEIRNERTYSQWIFYELSISKRIKVTRPERLFRRPMRESSESYMSHFCLMDSLPFEYDVDGLIKSMVNLNDAKLEEWAVNHNANKSGEVALDELYKICFDKH